MASAAMEARWRAPPRAAAGGRAVYALAGMTMAALAVAMLTVGGVSAAEPFQRRSLAHDSTR
jgi:hypothetical protein